MKSAQFNVGDVVQLKSSDTPQMTIVEVFDQEVECCWSESDKLKRDKFPHAALIKTQNAAENQFREIINRARLAAKARLDSESKSCVGYPAPGIYPARR